MTHQTLRLEQALRFWEDRCYFFRLVWRFKQRTGHGSGQSDCPQIGPILHWHSLRKHLLKACNSDAKFELEKYCGSGEFKNLNLPQLLPYYLWQWNRCSRRIYQMSRELQLLLRATSLDGVKWGDIKLPFETFAIQLPDPIQDPKSGLCYDVVLVSQNEVDSVPRLDYVLLNANLETYSAVRPIQREGIERDFSKQRYASASHRMKEINDGFNSRYPVDVSINLDKMKDAPIAEHDIEEFERIDTVSLHNQATRILVGLCLYLRTLPPQSPHQSEWKPANKAKARTDSRCITSEAQICIVSSTHTLTRDEQALLETSGTGPSGYELRAHFRCGHWRRPPGLGSDPMAEKTVWVKPTLVRRDRLPTDSLPEGSTHVLT